MSYFKNFADPRMRELRDVLGGKSFSILGDSISTWEGISNDANSNSTIGNNEVFYRGSMYVREPKYTWWGMLQEKTGMRLLVNNSWSGSCVCVNENKPASEGCGARAENLHANSGEEPNVIIVYLGTNDYANKVALPVFAVGYDTMIKKIRARYPQAEVYCCTMLPHDRDFKTDEPVKATDYNSIIRDVASKYKVPVIDLERDINLKPESYRASVTSRRALHPSEGGMDQIALSVINTLAGTHDKDNLPRS